MAECPGAGPAREGAAESLGPCLAVLLAGCAAFPGVALAAEKVSVGGDSYGVEWLHRYRFDGGDLRDWTVEGTSEVREAGGRLAVDGLDRGSQATIWNNHADLPADLIVRYRFGAGAGGDNKRNFNQFSHATEPGGGSPVGRRDGRYCDYQVIPNYLVTFTFDHAKLRRDPIPAGTGCPTEDPAVVKGETADVVGPSTEHDVVYTVVGGRVRYYVDGRLIHDWTDPSPLPGGSFGLRTFRTRGWWDDVEIGRIVP